MTERAVSTRLVSYLNENSMMLRLQSAYRRHHSTETALVKVLLDIFVVVDQQQVTLLGLLDLSAAFDCVNGDVLLVWYLWTSTQLDSVIPPRPDTTSLLQAVLIRSSSATLWCTARVCFRTTSVLVVHV